MDEVLDQPLFDKTTPQVKYGGFWARLGALLLDGLILSPISFGLTYFNISSWKSALLLVLISVIGIAYKPFMEFNYGATWGKMALKLKVTNAEFGKAEFSEILLRNIFHILPTLITLLYTVAVVFTNPDFESVSGWGDYTKFLQQFKTLTYINYASGLVTLVDAIMLVADDQKRSLHDRIGKTFVIEHA
ncbi:MAG TPA: hypothetical protein DGG95_16030 [Cytophagales bacterium]|jgi:uncharacterized RDD family membrane protein YckC|nr:hypothetical protein [Cytophagales bacterium]